MAKPAPAPSNAKSTAAKATATSTAFWDLMDRWAVPEDQALRLIDAPSRRFSMTPERTERFKMLHRIDALAAQEFRDASEWLRRPNRSTLFQDRPPLHTMATGRGGIEATLLFLEKTARGPALAAAQTTPHKSRWRRR